MEWIYHPGPDGLGIYLLGDETEITIAGTTDGYGDDGFTATPAVVATQLRAALRALVDRFPELRVRTCERSRQGIGFAGDCGRPGAYILRRVLGLPTVCADCFKELPPDWRVDAETL